MDTAEKETGLEPLQNLDENAGQVMRDREAKKLEQICSTAAALA
jgi:hypothetical protein